jgi:hypothetical protein
MIKCVHCERPILDGRRRFHCGNACRNAAYRRRKAGLAENFRAGAGRRGRIPLTKLTKGEAFTLVLANANIDEMIRELQERHADD